MGWCTRVFIAVKRHYDMAFGRYDQRRIKEDKLQKWDDDMYDSSERDKPDEFTTELYHILKMFEDRMTS